MQQAQTEIVRAPATRAPAAPFAAFTYAGAAGDSLERLCEELRARREEIAALIHRHGGALLRGFAALDSAEAFQTAVLAMGGAPMEYVGGTSPRSRVTGAVMTATEVPPAYSIPLHQEMSYMIGGPDQIAFWCDTPASGQGYTTLADARRVLAALDPALAERFRRNGVQLRRTLVSTSQLAMKPGIPKTWNETFQTDDCSAVEQIAAEKGWRAEWLESGALMLWQGVVPGIRRHPVTGEEVWHNQVPIFEPHAALDWARRDGRTEDAGKIAHALHHDPELLDTLVLGEGETISAEDVAAILAALEENTFSFRWEKGDLLVLDNILTMHGRTAFTGTRRLLTMLITSAPRAASRTH
jgi:alpha-ketoglutarate-dependent taurine dioxygenase